MYELEGTLETLTADLGRAMRAGVISLPDWFTRFASLEAIAVGERVTLQHHGGDHSPSESS
jgi:hypothetical protein